MVLNNPIFSPHVQRLVFHYYLLPHTFLCCAFLRIQILEQIQNDQLRGYGLFHRLVHGYSRRGMIE